MKQFKDFAKPYVKLEGRKLKIKEIMGKQIIVHNTKITISKYPNSTNIKCLTIQFSFIGQTEKFIVFTGSSILITQFETYNIELPFQTAIEKTEGCFTLT